MSEVKLPWFMNGGARVKMPGVESFTDEDRSFIKSGGSIGFRKVGPGRYTKYYVNAQGRELTKDQRALQLMKEINDLRMQIVDLEEEESEADKQAAQAEFQRLRPRRRIW